MKKPNPKGNDSNVANDLFVEITFVIINIQLTSCIPMPVIKTLNLFFFYN